ncbi:phosphotransferase [Wenzhouxiangella sp. XN201]|uniref:phosphotransferase n=1 Tax=Wenzhouxiangella sp. XN201 TaxID=2710755 RepID=UPI0013C68607|nr:phosphotransferase [Wenzhouxiangella sp. XN201]
MSTTDDRRELAQSWAAAQLGWKHFDAESVSSDASFRRYFRLRRGDACHIVMDAPPEHEDTDRFADVAARLRRSGVHVPEVLAHDTERGLMLLEDLGCRPYHQVLDANNADALFGDALDAMLRFQRGADPQGLPDYDPALLMRELALFPDWFLARHWQVDPTDGELDAWDLVCATLIRWALDQPQVFCHRDFMPRNLMVAEPNPGIIDFQDAVRGPISYDPVCLFRDAFLSWPPEQVDGWLEHYRNKALEAGLPVPEDADLWRRTCDFMGVQRHLKVIGIFARIRYRDGKPRYLEDAPRFFAYLDQAIDRNPELGDLRRLLAAWRNRSA